MNNLLVTIEITGRCNISCIHCLREKNEKRKDLNYNLFTKIAKQLKKYNSPYIALTGGEPTIHKNFIKILSYLSKEGFEYHFVSNGYNFPNIFEKILPFKQKGLSRVCFSIDGANEATHDKIRVPGSYRKVIESIALCRAKEIPVSVQMVINKINRHEMHQTAYIASQMGIDKLHFCHMEPTFGSSSFDISLSPDEWLDVEKEVRELENVYKVPIVFSAGFFDETPLAHCQFLQGTALNIDFNGNLTYCCQISNMFDSSKRKDIICNLKNTSLFTGHKKYLDMINEVNKKRISSIQKGKLSKIDYFHCWYCLKEFGKISWMKVLKDNKWAHSDPHFKGSRNGKWGKTAQG